MVAHLLQQRIMLFQQGGALRNFELQHTGLQSILVQHRKQVLDQVAVVEPAVGDIDRGPKQRQAHRSPFTELAADLTEHPVRKLNHQPGFFHGGNEGAWSDQALFRMVPADQSLHANHFSGNGIDLRLIVKHKFLALQCGMQVFGDHRLLFQLLPQLPIKDKVIGVFQTFGLIHRHVRELQQIVLVQ
ncbi:hypothetical protein D3C75_619740 [compost metagenome]